MQMSQNTSFTCFLEHFMVRPIHVTYNFTHDPYNYISSKIVSLLKDQNERPKTRDILNTLYLFALPNAPKFSRNSFENFERFDSWLIQLYVKVQGAKTTAEEIIKCFLLNLEYEDVRGVINTNSITTKY